MQKKCIWNIFNGMMFYYFESLVELEIFCTIYYNLAALLLLW